MAVKTKKFSLDKKFYIKRAFVHQIKKLKLWFLIPAGIAVLGLVLNFSGIYRNWWILITAIVGGLLFAAFWYIQFYAASTMEQNAQLFERYSYEIDPRQILMKLNAKEGGVIKWDMIQSAEKDDTGFYLHMGTGQFIYFKNSVFNSNHDLKLFESILNRKNLL